MRPYKLIAAAAIMAFMTTIPALAQEKHPFWDIYESNFKTAKYVAEGVVNLDQVPEAGALISIGFAKPKGGVGGYARYVAICPPDWPFGVSVVDAPCAPLPKQPHPLKRDANGVLTPTP